jgi:branched-chain amino acid transport system substrate-binding protein
MAADYSFGIEGAYAMRTEIEKRGGTVLTQQLVPYTGAPAAGHFDAQLTQIYNAHKADVSLGGKGVQMIITIWAGAATSFATLYNAMVANKIIGNIALPGGAIDWASLTAVAAAVGNASLTLGEEFTGGAFYGYELPNNAVNDAMVNIFKEKKLAANRIMAPLGGVYAGMDTIYVPELLSAGGFITAQFMVDAFNKVPDLDTTKMIQYLESNVQLDTPRGKMRLRPEDHQGLGEMYYAYPWNDTRVDSPTYKKIIAKRATNGIIDGETAAPPIRVTRTDYVAPTPSFEVTVTVAGVIFLATIAVIFQRRRRR